MNETDIKDLLQRGERKALLLGEITGSLSVLVTKVDGYVYCDEIKYDIKNLFSLVMSRVNSIYYEDKNELQHLQNV
jgi:hypothetical protein